MATKQLLRVIHFTDDELHTSNVFCPPSEPQIVNALDLVFSKDFPTVRKSGFKFIEKDVKLIPSCFPSIAYLNVDCNGYYMIIINSNPKEKWQEKGKHMRKSFEDSCWISMSSIFRKNVLKKIQMNDRVVYYLRKYVKNCHATRCKVPIITAKLLWKIIVPLLDVSGIIDDELVKGFLRSVLWTKRNKYFFFFETMRMNPTVDYVIGRAVKNRFDMWGYLSNNIRFDAFPFCPVMHCVLGGHIERLRTLLKYGFQRIPAAVIANFCRSGDENPTYLRYNVFLHLGWRGPLSNIPLTELDTYSLQRVFLLVETLYGLNLRPPVYKTWKICYDLLWNSMPDPYLSVDEFDSLLPVFYNAQIGDTLLRHLPFKKSQLPLNKSTLTPRRLKHLSRCIVRSILRQNFQLPEGLTWLFNNAFLPKELEPYLRLEE